MKRIILSLITIMFVFTTNSFSQLDTVLGPHIYLYHPLDTVISDGNQFSPTFNKHLVKRLYLKAIEDIFGDFPFTGYLNVDSILPQFSNQRILLQSITSQFGNYLLKYDTMNTIDVNSRFMYYLEFSGYYDYDSLMTIFESDSIISAETWVPDYSLTSIPSDLGLQPRVHFSVLSFNSDELSIRLTDFENVELVEIYDLLGICQIRSQIQGSETVIDISKLTSGMYIIRVGSHFSKFIRE